MPEIEAPAMHAGVAHKGAEGGGGGVGGGVGLLVQNQVGQTTLWTISIEQLRVSQGTLQRGCVSLFEKITQFSMTLNVKKQRRSPQSFSDVSIFVSSFTGG